MENVDVPNTEPQPTSELRPLAERFEEIQKFIIPPSIPEETIELIKFMFFAGANYIFAEICLNTENNTNSISEIAKELTEFTLALPDKVSSFRQDGNTL